MYESLMNETRCFKCKRAIAFYFCLRCGSFYCASCAHTRAGKKSGIIYECPKCKAVLNKLQGVNPSRPQSSPFTPPSRIPKPLYSPTSREGHLVANQPTGSFRQDIPSQPTPAFHMPQELRPVERVCPMCGKDNHLRETLKYKTAYCHYCGSEMPPLEYEDEEPIVDAVYDEKEQETIKAPRIETSVKPASFFTPEAKSSNIPPIGQPFEKQLRGFFPCPGTPHGTTRSCRGLSQG